MQEETIFFCGLLTNVDSSIVEVKLEHNFKIDYKKYNTYIDFFSALEGLSPKETNDKLSNHACYNVHDKKYYFVSNSFCCSNEKIHSHIRQFQDDLIIGYLEPVLRLMRLFQTGNITMPIRYYYRFINNKPRSAMHTSTSMFPIRESYTLDSLAVQGLNTFIRDTKVPFEKEFVNLAFENFDLSYTTHNVSLSFLSLMSGLEALFNPGKEEITYRLSRNIATLLGKEQAESQRIFDEVKSLYNKRSLILHTGKIVNIKRDELNSLRFYIRESIKLINKLNVPKKQLMGILNSIGFGQRDLIIPA